MTLQRSLFVSIGIHVLLFGTAIAFAGYAGGALRGRHATSISVTLVGSGSLAGSTRAANSVAPQRRSSSVPPARDQDMPSPERHPTDDAGGIAEQALINVDEGQKIGPKMDTGGNAESSRQNAGAQFGIDLAGPKAVIEAALDRAKVYPRLARERGIQGTVHLRFKLKPSGEVDRVEIAKSSGYDVLDAASIKTVYRISPMPYVNGWMEVSMPYMLK